MFDFLVYLHRAYFNVLFSTAIKAVYAVSNTSRNKYLH